MAIYDTNFSYEYTRGNRYRDRESWRYLHRESDSSSGGVIATEEAVEQFLSGHLPARCHGGADHSADCLCDVDVSKTAGMVFDQVPECLLNVETADDLVKAAALLWLKLDVNCPNENHMAFLDLSEEDRQYVIRRIREGAWRRDLVAEGYDVHHSIYGMIQRMFDVQHPQSTVDYRELAQLHDEGLSSPEIHRVLVAQGSKLKWPENVSQALHRIGIVPHDGRGTRWATAKRMATIAARNEADHAA